MPENVRIAARERGGTALVSVTAAEPSFASGAETEAWRRAQEGVAHRVVEESFGTVATGPLVRVFEGGTFTTTWRIAAPPEE